MNLRQAEPLLKFLVLETTRRCNLRCVHCAVSEENNLGAYDARDLPMDLFRKILAILRDFRPKVQLSGHGETLLHPHFMNMVEEVCRLGCQVVFQTNGTILSHQQVERFVRLGVERIVFSIDAASAGLFEKIRRRAKLTHVLSNIHLLNETKRTFGSSRPTLGVEFVAMRQNIHELPLVVRLAGELGAATVQVAELTEYNLTRGQSLANDPLMIPWAKQAAEEAVAWGVQLLLPSNIPRSQGTAAEPEERVIDADNPATYRGFRKDCNEPWESMFVQFSGEVRPCCVITESYGNLSVQNFEEVWHGQKYQALREALISDAPPAPCLRCPFKAWRVIDSATAVTEPTAAAESTVFMEAAPPSLVERLRLKVLRIGRGILRKATVRDPTIVLSDQQLRWILIRLGSPELERDFVQIREGSVSLTGKCLELLLGPGSAPLPDSLFVSRAYRRLLGREPDVRGFQGYFRALVSRKITRTLVISSFLSSDEFQRILPPSKHP